MDQQNKYPFYENAPIILAIIQLRYNKISEFDNKQIRKIGQNISKEFPNVNESVLQTVRFDNKNKQEETKVLLDSREINGVRFASEDNSKVLVVGNEKFTYEISGPYPGWDVLKNDVKRLWEIFNPELDNLEINGASMRFVNKFNLPIETTDLAKYFTTYIHSNTGNHPINTFQLRYTSTENNFIMHMGHALELAIENVMPYIFDIDVIKLGKIANEESAIWNTFEEIREKKNYIFNDALTEPTKNLIK